MAKNVRTEYTAQIASATRFFLTNIFSKILKEDTREKSFLYLYSVIIKNLPNLLTLCNLFCGCIAIFFASKGNFGWSAYLVVISCVFDFLDGMVARLLNVNSEIGKQLDSLADVVSFGVVPGMIMFGVIEEVTSLPLLSLIAFLIPIFSAVRLAKFNLDARQSDSFIGLPTPANALLISGMLSLEIYGGMDGLLNNIYFLVAVTLISCFLLIAPLPLFALKFKNFSWVDNKVRYIFLAFALVLLVVFQFAGISLIIILYIILSVINNIISKRKTQL